MEKVLGETVKCLAVDLNCIAVDVKYSDNYVKFYFFLKSFVDYFLGASWWSMYQRYSSSFGIQTHVTDRF